VDGGEAEGLESRADRSVIPPLQRSKNRCASGRDDKLRGSRATVGRGCVERTASEGGRYKSQEAAEMGA